jgi:nitroreductase
MNNQNMYDALFSLCQKRCSVRSFSEKPLSAEQIEKIKAIAMTSPYASGRKHWEIIVITEKETIEKMAEIVRAQVKNFAEGIRSDYTDDFLTYAKNFSVFAEAPALFIPVFRNAPLVSLMIDGSKNNDIDIINKEEIAIWERDNYVKSISCVCMLILLAAESLELSSCYMTGPLLAEKSLGSLFKLKPGYSIGALIPVGYAKTGDEYGKTGD